MTPSPPHPLGRWLALACCLSPLLFTGCTPQTATVKGKVYLNGVPLKGGSVTMINRGGISQPGVIAEDGSYTVTGVSTGEVKICVDTENLNFKNAPLPHTYSPPKGAPVPEGGYNPAEGAKANMAKRYVKIPEKYSKEDTTDLTLTITGSSMEYDINLYK